MHPYQLKSMEKKPIIATWFKVHCLAKMERLIELLKDGKWHSLEEIAEKTETSPEKLEELLKTLSEYQLIRYDRELKAAKLNLSWKKLEVEEKNKERKEEKMALGTIIIPKEHTIIVQNTRISNLTEEELELEIKMDKKIKEIAIKKLN